MLRPAEARAVANDPAGAVIRVLEAEELHALFGKLFGEPAKSLDYKWFRAVVPPQDPAEVHGSFHVDKVYMGRGASQLTTAWIPWHDIAPADGGPAAAAAALTIMIVPANPQRCVAPLAPMLELASPRSQGSRCWRARPLSQDSIDCGGPTQSTTSRPPRSSRRPAGRKTLPLSCLSRCLRG